MNDRDDPILDACLEELLAQQAPPDLSARILRAWAARQDQPATEAGPPAPNGASRPLPVRPIPIHPAVAGPQTAPPSANGHPQVSVASRAPKHSAWQWGVLAVSAAAVALIAVGVARRLSQSPTRPERNLAGTQARPAPKVPAPAVPAPKTPTPAPHKAPGPNSGLAQKAPSGGTSSQGSGAMAQQPRVVEEGPAFPSAPLPPPQPLPPPGQIADQPAPDKPAAVVVHSPSPAKEILSFVNQELAEAWAEASVKPAPNASDAEWCRRLFVRLLGRIPTVEEAREFLADRRVDKRERLAQRIIGDAAYADELARNWASLWTTALIGRTGGQQGDLARREGLQDYLREQFLRNRPFNEVVQALLTASGSPDAVAADYNGAVNFLLSGFTPEATLATSRVARVFLGTNLQCAQCHNHPTNHWTQHDYWALNAFFRQLHVERAQGQTRLVDRDYSARSGDSDSGYVAYQLPTGVMKVAYPEFLDGTKLPRTGRLADVNRRERLAELVSRSEALPRAVVNRVWAHFFGYGFTQPIDDIGSGNQPSHPEVLARLSQEFVAHDYDFKTLLRWVALSEAFGRSSQLTESNLADSPEAGAAPLFSRYYTRQLQAEEAYQSLLTAARLRKASGAGGEGVAARMDWLGQFSRPMATDDGQEESSFDGSLRQSLIMMNGDLMRRATNHEQDGLLRGVVQSQLKFDEKVSHLFLAALSRNPTKRELDAVRQLAAAGSSEATTLADIWWALLNSNEFILDH